MAMTLANTIPGHLAAPGKLSDTHELIRVQTMEIMFICMRERGLLTLDIRATYAERNNVDLGNRENSWLSRDVVTLYPEDHWRMLALHYSWERKYGCSLDPPDWPTWVRNAKNRGT